MNETQEAAILTLLRAGATQREVGEKLGLNHVTVGRVAKRAGITYPEAQKSAYARRGKPHRKPEKEFQGEVEREAAKWGWDYFHPWISIHSAAGFPDLTMVRTEDGLGQLVTPRLIFAELKAEDGEVTGNQQKWLRNLGRLPFAEVYIWRPSDFERIQQILHCPCPTLHPHPLPDLGLLPSGSGSSRSGTRRGGRSRSSGARMPGLPRPTARW